MYTVHTRDMDTTQTTAAAAFYNLRIVRGTTGTVHAAHESQREILDFSKVYTERGTGRYETILTKACGSDNNSYGARNGATRTVDPTTTVTCQKCAKRLAE